eukprot:gene9092-52140_t
MLPYATDVWKEVEAGTLEILLRPRSCRGIAIAHSIVTAAFRSLTPDRQSVPTHPRAFAQFWIADAITQHVYPSAHDEVAGRLADGPRPFLWDGTDAELTARIRDRTRLSLARDGGLAGLQLGVQRPRGAQRDPAVLDPCRHCKHSLGTPPRLHHPYTECSKTGTQRRDLLLAMALKLSETSGHTAE